MCSFIRFKLTLKGLGLHFLLLSLACAAGVLLKDGGLEFSRKNEKTCAGANEIKERTLSSVLAAIVFLFCRVACKQVYFGEQACTAWL